MNFTFCSRAPRSWGSHRVCPTPTEAHLTHLRHRAALRPRCRASAICPAWAAVCPAFTRRRPCLPWPPRPARLLCRRRCSRRCRPWDPRSGGGSRTRAHCPFPTVSSSPHVYMQSSRVLLVKYPMQSLPYQRKLDPSQGCIHLSPLERIFLLKYLADLYTNHPSFRDLVEFGA